MLDGDIQTFSGIKQESDNIFSESNAQVCLLSYAVTNISIVCISST